MTTATTDRPRTTTRAANKHEKADSLYKLGYRITRVRNMEILISNPSGAIYHIDCTAGTCSCPASVACCHLLGIHGLLLDQGNALGCRAQEMLRAGGNTAEWMTLAGRAKRMSDRAFDVLLALEARDNKGAAA